MTRHGHMPEQVMRKLEKWGTSSSKAGGTTRSSSKPIEVSEQTLRCPKTRPA